MSEAIDKRNVTLKLNVALSSHDEQVWKEQLERETDVNGQESNKLHIYCLFKKEPNIENSLICTLPRKYRSVLAKVRCGAAPIRIETGRYERLPSEDRLCQMCNTEQPETEEHLLISCPQYIDVREEIFQKALEIQPLFNHFEPVDKMCFLLSCVNPQLVYPVTKCIFDMMHGRKCLLYT